MDRPADRCSEARRRVSLFRPVVSSAFRFAFAIFASAILVVFVSGAYKPPFPVFSGKGLDSSGLQQQERPPENNQLLHCRSCSAANSGSVDSSLNLAEIGDGETVVRCQSWANRGVRSGREGGRSGVRFDHRPANGVASSSPTNPPDSAESPPIAAAPPPTYSVKEPPEDQTSSPPSKAQDKILRGMADSACLSRYQPQTYLRDSPYVPSPDLSRSLRRYEALHASCGPRTEAFKKSTLLLRSPSSHGGRSKCKYLIWTPENGLGNQMISLASSFLYALLSDRVLLIDRGKDLQNLFCEPFPGSSWLLPQEFPLKFRAIFNKSHPARLGKILSSGDLHPPMIYAHLSHDYEDQDKRFYCEKEQNQLNQIPWMVLKSDQYFIPALFLLPKFNPLLHQFFPEKETVFHLLSRYLFRPSNSVWNLIRSYFDSHLAGSREKMGVQIRIHGSNNQIIDLVTRQIINCTEVNHLLPKPEKTVLLTSLRSEFLGRLRRIYSSSSLRFFQPSQEGKQQTGREEHDAKALAEMFLLGMVDELLTSAWSTFGYVAQGIGGIKPWILRGPVHSFVPSPACVRDSSIEPCFHFPPNFDCGTGSFALTKKVFPFIKQCRDRSPGVKLVDWKRKKKTGR